MKKILPVLLLCALVLMFSACGKEMEQEDADRETIAIYYLNKAETGLISEDYLIDSEDNSTVLSDVMLKLQNSDDILEKKAPLGMGCSMLDYYIEEKNRAVVNVDIHYNEFKATTEILVRAAIVRTITQIPGIDYVLIKVNGEALTDHDNAPVGIMSADTFVDNDGAEINSYEKVKLKLYFANETGESLVEVDRSVLYNTNISLEKLVIEQLIVGPSNQDSFPTMNPNTVINSVTVKDRTCYVNLDQTFLNPLYNVKAEVTIYSIVDSLIELNSVSKVQISIDGNTGKEYQGLSLDKMFERNLDLLENEVKKGNE